MDAGRGVFDVLNGFETAVMVTGSDDGRVDCQLLRMAHVGDCGTIWLLAASTSTGACAPVRDAQQVMLVFQRPSNGQMWLSGMVQRVADRERLAELWQGPFRKRFPDGPDDMETVLAVRPERASAWDAGSYPRHFIFP